MQGQTLFRCGRAGNIILNIDLNLNDGRFGGHVDHAWDHLKPGERGWFEVDSSRQREWGEGNEQEAKRMKNGEDTFGRVARRLR